MLGQIKARGVNRVGMFVFDDLTGLDTVISKVFSSAMQQKCILHFQCNLHKHVRVGDRKEFGLEVAGVFTPDIPAHSKESALKKLQQVLNKWAVKYPKLGQVLARDDLELFFTYLAFDHRIRRMIYTTNWIERLNKFFRGTLEYEKCFTHSTSGNHFAWLCGHRHGREKVQLSYS